MSLVEFVADAPLTLILKPGGGIHHIAIDTLEVSSTLGCYERSRLNISMNFNLILGYQVVQRPFSIVSIGC